MKPKTTEQLWETLHHQGWLSHHPPISFVMRNHEAIEKQRDELLDCLKLLVRRADELNYMLCGTSDSNFVTTRARELVKRIEGDNS